MKILALFLVLISIVISISSVSALCGNSVVEEGESCDGTNMTIFKSSIQSNCSHRYSYINESVSGNLSCLPDCTYNISECMKSLGSECYYDSDCDDSKDYTLDSCRDKEGFYYNLTATANCFHQDQLIGERTYKTLVVEFNPQEVKYGEIYHCYNPTTFVYSEDPYDAYSLVTEDYNCKYKLNSSNFLELLNNQKKITTFEPVNNKVNNNFYSLFYINDYLKREANRYGISEIPYFNFELKEFTLNDLPPVSDGSWGVVDSYFDSKLVESGMDVSAYDLVIIIYFNDYDALSNVDKHSFVNHESGNKIYISADTFRVSENFLYPAVIIHELLHFLGANEGYVFGEIEGNEWCSFMQCCIGDSSGVPNPKIYPQTAGCIMCANFPTVKELGKNQERLEDLNRLLVCPETAREIGWLIKSSEICTDSDGGKNYQITGSVTKIIKNESLEIEIDSCNVDGTLKEWYCESGLLISEDISCPTDSLCNSGKCLQESSFEIKICKDQACSEKSNFFSKNSNVYIDYSSETLETQLLAILTYPNMSCERIALPTKIMLGQVGTYKIEASVLGVDSPVNLFKESFRVIENEQVTQQGPSPNQIKQMSNYPWLTILAGVIIVSLVVFILIKKIRKVKLGAKKNPPFTSTNKFA